MYLACEPKKYFSDGKLLKEKEVCSKKSGYYIILTEDAKEDTKDVYIIFTEERLSYDQPW